MAHGIAEGVEPSAAELGQVPDTVTGGLRFHREDVFVANGQKDVKVAATFTRDAETNECELLFKCRFPGSDEQGQDWDKAAECEAHLKTILGGYIIRNPETFLHEISRHSEEDEPGDDG
jgi:hypothetical protein